MKPPDLPYRRRALKPKRTFRTWLEKHAFLLTLIGGIVGYALSSGSDALENSAKAWDWWKVDRTFTGRWTNNTEGHLDPPIDVHNVLGGRVDLALSVENGDASGDIHSEKLCDYNPHAYVFIEGRRRWWGWGGIRALAWDYRDGKRVAFADLIITHDGSTGNLEVRTVEPSLFFPEKVRLYRSSKEVTSVSDDIAPFCSDFLETIKSPQKSASQPVVSGVRERRPVEELTFRSYPLVREQSLTERVPGATADSSTLPPISNGSVK